MVEQVFTEPLTDERYAAFAKRLDPCIEMRNGAWRRSAVSKDRLRVVCEFEAPDAESVRESYRLSRVPFERIWAAEVYAVEHYPEAMKRLEAVVQKNAK
jgi:hypothetical protein